MVDWLSTKIRSKIMSSIRSKNTKPEMMLKKNIRGLGFSYQPKIKGHPDFVNYKRKMAVFVHGCFWHKCAKCYRQPASKLEYWIPKIEGNVARDKRNKQILQMKGYSVIEIWEHVIRNDPVKAAKKIKMALT